MSNTNAATSSSFAPTVEGIAPHVIADADRHRTGFVSAKPFRHCMIDGFFEPEFAEQLLREFPSFDPNLARNEMGEVRGKAVNTKIREISPSYKRLYEIIGGKPFLELVSRLSGIPDLILDPKMYGGGTHENLHGQELDVHVDFNYDETQGLHRRLNLIVYLNKDWQTEWGGAIEIHSNPRDPQTNEITAYDPLFNRAVMFETNEISWHGFPRIDLPPGKRHLSRKSISIYLYTTTRPVEEIAPPHSTFYVQRPLPKHIQAGHTLTEADVATVRELLIRRDNWITFYHKKELEVSAQIVAKNAMIAQLLRQAAPPLTGYVLPGDIRSGYYPDRWTTSCAEIELKPLAPVSAILLRGWRPENAPEGKVRVRVGTEAADVRTAGDLFELRLPFSSPLQEPFTVRIESESEKPLIDPSVDSRDLQFAMLELRSEHPRTPELEALLGWEPAEPGN
jgi:Rps23 Pro-64 3,4-dihydroxylase Tpa1-like proline 4-hydroxylase